MIIVDKEHHAYLKRELNDRFTKLWDMLHGRPLKDKYEGVGKGSYWPNPESRVAIDATQAGIRLAVADFNAILSEVKKL